MAESLISELSASEHPAETNAVRRTIRASAPGKINLTLSAGSPREDGYHPLQTVFLAVSLTEELVLTAHPGDLPVLSLHPDSDASLDLGSIPLDERNIALAAVRAVWEAAGIAPVHSAEASLVITKRVPVAGGMAGGSADAAAALVAANALLPAPLSRRRLLELAAGLGADVPFCLVGGAALGTGAGEELRSLSAAEDLAWTVVFSAEQLSTPAVFQRLDAQRAEAGKPDVRPTPPNGAVLAALAAGDAPALAESLRASESASPNDLQAPAIALIPSIAQTLEQGRELGALAGFVSGSGPSVVLLARDAQQAIQLADALIARGHPKALAVQGPVPGARILE